MADEVPQATGGRDGRLLGWLGRVVTLSALVGLQRLFQGAANRGRADGRSHHAHGVALVRVRPRRGDRSGAAAARAADRPAERARAKLGPLVGRRPSTTGSVSRLARSRRMGWDRSERARRLLAAGTARSLRVERVRRADPAGRPDAIGSNHLRGASAGVASAPARHALGRQALRRASSGLGPVAGASGGRTAKRHGTRRPPISALHVPPDGRGQGVAGSRG